MLKNANLLQNPADIQLKPDDKELLIQALANLGQRIGIKGDGISYKYFTFNDLINDNSFTDDQYVGYLRYIKDENNKYKSVFGVVDKLTLTDYHKFSDSVNINDCLYFPNDLEFDIPIGGIEKYSKNSICINDGTDLTFMLAGKHIGTNDNEDLNTTLYYYKFDISTNKLKYGAKLFHYNKTNDDDMYCLINTINTEYENNSYSSNSLSDEYNMYIKLFNINYIKSSSNNYYYNLFRNIFKFSNYNNLNNIPFSIIKEEYEDISNLIFFSEENDIQYETNSAIAIINNSIENSLYGNHKLKLYYDTNRNELLSLDEEYNEEYIDLYKNEYNLNLDEEIGEINEDIKNLYYNIFNYYNEKFYLNSKTEFIKRILSKLYESISNYNYDSDNILYIPLNYQFNYTCNSNNPLNIYYSNNFYVTFTELNKLYLDEFWDNNNMLIYDYAGIDKVKCYNFEVNYNKNDESLINYVRVKTIYTMPYINTANTWSINDNDTKITATGKDAGNPNIIIINNIDKNNNGDEGSYVILNAIENKKQIFNAEYQQKWVQLNPALFDNITDTDIKCCNYIPVIDEKNIEYFKYSVILSISNLDCLNNTEYAYQYKGSYIITIWHLIENDGSFEFDYIKQKDENSKYAIALGSTVNLLNETSNSSLEDLDEKDLLLLKAIVSHVGQESLSYTHNNWLIFKNKLSEEYADNNEDIGNYFNDLNGIIQYNDTVNIKNNHIIHSQKSKYNENISNLKITNSLYPKYETTKIVETNNSNIIKILKNNGSSVTDTRFSKIIVDGNVITNSESLIEEISSELTEETINKSHTLIFETSNKLKSNYNEYVFNTNVPTLDFSEVFNRNFNVLNRVNIISLDSQGKIYNAYIGNSFDENSKSILHIGSSSTNINVGTNTLINEYDKYNFNTHDTLSLDFNNIILNASNKLISAKPIELQYNFNGVQYNTLNIPLIGQYYNPTANPTNKLFAKITNNNREYTGFIEKGLEEPTTHTYYCINVNYLMDLYFKKSINTYKANNVKIHINNGLSKTYNNYHYVLLEDNYYKNDAGYFNIIDELNSLVYCNFRLNIMYYENNGNAENRFQPMIHIYISIC